MLIWDKFSVSLMDNEKRGEGNPSSTVSPIMPILLLKTMKNNYNKRYYQHIEQLCYKPALALFRNLAGSSFNKSMHACQI